MEDVDRTTRKRKTQTTYATILVVNEESTNESVNNARFRLLFTYHSQYWRKNIQCSTLYHSNIFISELIASEHNLLTLIDSGKRVYDSKVEDLARSQIFSSRICSSVLVGITTSGCGTMNLLTATRYYHKLTDE